MHRRREDFGFTTFPWPSLCFIMQLWTSLFSKFLPLTTNDAHLSQICLQRCSRWTWTDAPVSVFACYPLISAIQPRSWPGSRWRAWCSILANAFSFGWPTRLRFSWVWCFFSLHLFFWRATDIYNFRLWLDGIGSLLCHTLLNLSSIASILCEL